MLPLLAVLSLVAISLGQQTTQEVSFSCGLTTSPSYTTATVVKYDTCFNNFGGGYDRATGRFTATQPGVYVFQFHTLTESGAAAWLELYKNNMYICTSYGHNSNDYMSAGNSAILQLDKGDQVFIKTVDSSYGDATNMYGSPTEIYSTFTGYMVSPVLQDVPGHNGK